MRKLVAVVALLVLIIGWSVPAGAYPRPGRTVRLSPLLDADGGAASGGRPLMSGDGRWVAFTTTSRLVAADGNGHADVYVREVATGAIERVSVATDGREGNGTSSAPAISADGSFVAFHSNATTLVGSDANGSTTDVYLRDRVAQTTTLVSVSSAGEQNDASATNPSISDDGTVVAFLSSSTNLVPGDTNASLDAFARDVSAGTTERLSVGSDGSQGVTPTQHLSLSGNGRYAVFIHRMAWDGDASGFDDVFVRDRLLGATELVSRASDGSQPNGQSFYPSISDDGRYVAFGTFGANLVPNDMNGAADAFVRDRQTGVTERVSLTSAGVEANHVWGVPIISGDGRYVTGNVLATNFGYADANGNTDVYVHDRVTRALELASGTPDGTATGNGISYYPSISDDGRRVAFVSAASDLVPDGGKGSHVYLRELGPVLGTGPLTVRRASESVDVAGWARFAGTSLLEVADPATDGGAAARAAAGEITRVGVTYRPEESDVLFAINVAPTTYIGTPFVGTTLRKPGALTYGVEFDVAGQRWEVRATAGPTGPTFGLYRCAPGCAHVHELDGGIGTAGDVALVTVPADLLGGEDALLGLRHAYTAAADQQGAPVRVLDDAALRTVAIPRTTLEVGSAPAGARMSDVRFTRINHDAGVFSAAVPAGSAAQDVWTRACVGAVCSATSANVEG